MEMKKKVLLIFCFLVMFFVPGVLAVGVSPAIYKVDFEPSFEGEFTFNFRAESDSQSLEIYVEGDLARYVTYAPEMLVGSGEVTVSVRLPESVDPPGRQRILVGARPFAPEGGTVGAVASVRGSIDIWVPYPGKYVDLEFEVEDVNAGDKAPYELKIYSRGEEAIVAKSTIEVYDSDNESIGEFVLDSMEVLPTDFIEINSELDVSSLRAGDYWAEVSVDYGGGERVLQDAFRLGEESVGIVNYTQEVARNEIVPFVIEIESLWNDPINHLYAEVSVVGTDNSFLTPTISLEPWEEAELQGYLYTGGIEGDSFQANLAVIFGDKIVEKTVEVRLIKEEVNYFLWGGIILGALVAVGFVVWVVLKLKRLEKKSGKKK